MEENMKSTRISVTLLGLAALAIITSPLVAVADEDSGWYIGGGIGQAKATIDNARITSALLGGGVTTTSITNNNRSFGYKVFGGYQINQYLSVESGFFDLGKFGYTATTAAPNAGTVAAKLRLNGLNLDLVGTLPLTEKLSALARVGGTYAQTRDNFITTGALTVANPNPSKRAWNYKFGGGLEYDMIKALSLRVEAERYRINDALNNRGDIDLFSVGLVYRFGKSTAPAPREEAPEAKPEPVVDTPPAAVITPLKPKKVPLIKEAFSTDSLFVFDSTKINPAGKQGLDKLAKDLKHTNFDMIYVTGYTDRIGAHDYNMALSTDRAEAVKAYLVDIAGVPSDKIEAMGVGEANPVTNPGECRGERASETSDVMANTLQACLAADRRVEIEVNATQKR